MSSNHAEHPPSACGCDHAEHTPTAPTGAVVLNAGARADERTTLAIAGMDCADEVAAVERALRPLAGVREVRVALMAGTAVITHESGVSAEQLIKAIGVAGLKASVPGTAGAAEEAAQAQRRRVETVALSGVLTAIGLGLEWTGTGPGWLRIAVFAVAIIAGGWFIFPKALVALRRVALDMNVLMSVAVAGAAAIGEWSEGAAVTFLFALSELLEAFSVQRARRAIESLLKLSPETALVRRGDAFVELRVEKVAVGDILSVKSGSRVPLDGEVTTGRSSINQAPITGESMPVEKKPGDGVFAGTINGEGSLEVRVTKLSGDSTLSKIIRLVEEAQGQKAPSQRFVDTFARYYTPAVFFVALLVWLLPPLLVAGASWGAWTYRALVLLVIACPCALVISTPVSIVSGLTAMARRGVLIKGGAFLESIGRLRALAVDKTGTITEGKPRVLSVVPVGEGVTEEQVIRIAAAIDVHSEHPLAQAVVAHAQEKGISFPRAEDYQARTGKGAEGIVEGHPYFVGNHRFTHELAVCSEATERLLEEIQARAQSVVVVGHRPHDGCEGQVLGVLGVGDAIRANAAEAIRSIHAAGIEKVVMLSGDNQRTADAIARQAGIDEAHGDLLPDQKIERVRALLASHGHVGMIGDGVNDAPAMAAATVGIAMGAAGTDTAIETADMALMQDDLSKVAEAMHLGRRTLGIIQFNIAFALVIKAIFLLLTLLGHASLWMAIAADTGATLLVVANALRLLRMRNEA